MHNTKFTTSHVRPMDVRTEMLAVGVFYDNLVVNLPVALDTASGGDVLELMRHERFSPPDCGKAMTVFAGKRLKAQHVTLVGLGKRAEFTIEKLREAAIAAFKEAKERGVSDITFAPVDFSDTPVTPAEYGRTLAAYAGMIDYETPNLKTTAGGYKAPTRFNSVTVLLDRDQLEQASDIERGFANGKVVSKSVALARDLVNLWPNKCTPTYMAQEAIRLSNESGGKITVRVLQREECERLGMGCFLSVSQGSAQPPMFIEMSYEPAEAKNDVVLGMIGKSITFDSGGLDIKPADGMRWMKGDMAGGAAVMAAIAAIAGLNIPLRVKAFMAATENMTGPAASRPGDVYTTITGLSVEIDNTDAEGRLTLADALGYAHLFAGCTHLVDLATLTGVVRQALGPNIAGHFTNNKEFGDQVLEAARVAGEHLWPLPMPAFYMSAIKSSVADLKNSGGSFGAGASTAALFLSKFVGDRPWVHIDMASTGLRGSAYAENPEGGSGFGVRSLIALACLLSGTDLS